MNLFRPLPIFVCSVNDIVFAALIIICIAGYSTIKNGASRSGARIKICSKQDLLKHIGRVEAKTHTTIGTDILSYENISVVVDCNKRAIFEAYRKELAFHPDLGGVVVLSVTVLPDGTVGRVKIVNSEWRSKESERRLVEVISRFQFLGAVENDFTFTYPIDFVPPR